MIALGVGHADAIVTRVQGELGAENGRQAEGAGGLGEAHDAVEAVVVGEGEAREPEAHRLSDEFFGVTRPVEEAETRMGVKFTVLRHQS